MHGKELSSEQRERIIGAHLGGVKQNVISAQLNIAPSTVNGINSVISLVEYAYE